MSISHKLVKRIAKQYPEISETICKDCLVKACCEDACSKFILFFIYKKGGELYKGENYENNISLL